jgi:hypothetical protein
MKLARAVEQGDTFYTKPTLLAEFHSDSRTAWMRSVSRSIMSPLGRVKLNISENPTADLTMKIASTTETVEVRAQTAKVDAEDAVTGQVVDRTLINNLPPIDRNVQALSIGRRDKLTRRRGKALERHP